MTRGYRRNIDIRDNNLLASPPPSSISESLLSSLSKIVVFVLLVSLWVNDVLAASSSSISSLSSGRKVVKSNKWSRNYNSHSNILHDVLLASNNNHRNKIRNSAAKSPIQTTNAESIHTILTLTQLLRGGSSMKPTKDNYLSNNNDDSNDNKELMALRQYQLQQQLLLSSRSLQLRQALISRGIQELQHTATEGTAANMKVPMDWECAVSSRKHPKSCLYSFDAEMGAKVIAPAGDNAKNYQWITLSSLNRLRRNDITKVEPLWHNQYHILNTWFTSSNHVYSLYQHLTPMAHFVSYILDEPYLLYIALLLGIIVSIIVTLPILEIIIRTVLVQKLIWIYWPNWSRFIHSALPLQLAIVQMILKLLQSVFLTFYNAVRNQLVEYECTLYEQCIPVTILEDEATTTNGNNDIIDNYDSILNKGTDEENDDFSDDEIQNIDQDNDDNDIDDDHNEDDSDSDDDDVDDEDDDDNQ